MFNWLFGKPKFRFYEDSFARTQDSMLEGLRKAILKRADRDENYFIVAHFPERFERLQSKLHAWAIDYEILSKPLRPSGVAHHFQSLNTRIVLCLSSLLVPEEASASMDETRTICAMATERHPLIDHDHRLEAFCRGIPTRVELGYFLSFEDATVKSLINESTLRILDVFGMGENELITSNMVSRRLRTVLTQDSRKYQSDQAADSAEEWIQLNRRVES